MHYVIGDVHGCYDEMIALINKIESSDKNAEIMFVGDFIDRGPKVWETLEWMMNNVSADGKYQSVLGNHEDLVLQEFASSGIEIPECEYGFNLELKRNGYFEKSQCKEILDFFRSLPLYKELHVTSWRGVGIDYVIAHAYKPVKKGKAITFEEEREAYLWSRRHVLGYLEGEGTILVHGHTPTISTDYNLRCNGAPGLIGYSYNSINVDGGCCYFYHGYDESPCMLCAICLETLAEIYPYTVEERYMQKSLDDVLIRVPEGISAEEFRVTYLKVLIERFQNKEKRAGYNRRKRLSIKDMFY